jgi:hypothetical protein
MMVGGSWSASEITRAAVVHSGLIIRTGRSVSLITIAHFEGFGGGFNLLKEPPSGWSPLTNIRQGRCRKPVTNVPDVSSVLIFIEFLQSRSSFGCIHRCIKTLARLSTSCTPPSLSHLLGTPGPCVLDLLPFCRRKFAFAKLTF